jgi:hypothetical protein
MLNYIAGSEGGLQLVVRVVTQHGGDKKSEGYGNKSCMQDEVNYLCVFVFFMAVTRYIGLCTIVPNLIFGGTLLFL